MANETTTSIVREDPRLEAYRLGLLKDTKDLISGRMGDVNALPPNYQVAGLTGLENTAAALGQEGIGSYVPYLQGAVNQVTAGQGLIEDAAIPTLGQGQEYMLEAGRLAQQTRELPYDWQNAAGEGFLQSAGTFDPQALSTQGYLNRVQGFDPSARRPMQFSSLAEQQRNPIVQQMSLIQNDTMRQLQGMDPSSPAAIALQEDANKRTAVLQDQLSTNSVEPFFNPYEDRVVQQTMQDIADQGAVQQQQARANAVSSGAFGGSRSGIMETELAKNILREQGRAAGGLRQQGYGAAMNSAQSAFENEQARRMGALGASQSAFENTQGRRQSAAQGIGGLGLSYGQLSQADVAQMQGIGQGLGSIANQYAGLGAQSANLGLQQAGLGEMAQRSNLADIQTLTGLGAMQRGQQQAELDAVRNSNVERLAAPYQQLGFLSDIYRGTPTSQATISSKNSQDPSTAQQVLGLGIAGLGAIGGARTGLGF
jgi:hypothetical protein